MSARVYVNIEGALRKLNDLEREQAPFIAALALTKTAKAVQGDLQREMRSSFKNPTGFTLNSIFIEKAVKKAVVQQAKVGIKGSATNTGSGKWLKAEIYGGTRDPAIEVLLKRVNLPPRGLYAVPGPEAKLTSRGKLDINWLSKVLSALDPKAGENPNPQKVVAKRKRGKPIQYFALLVKWGSLPPGIYGRRGEHLLPLLFFVRRPHYSKRFDFYGVGKASAVAHFPTEFRNAVAYALQTAR